MAVNIGPKIGIDGEKEYRKQVNNLITQTKTYSAEMRELESSFDESTSAMEKNRKKGELLNKQIANQEKTVEELEKGLKASAEKYGENATETQKWKQAVANAKTELNKMRSELDKVPKSLKQVASGFKNVGSKMQKVGGDITKYVSAPMTAFAAATVAAFNEVDEGMDIVVKKTGATGEALKDLQDSARNIAKTIPTSFADAGSAVGEVNTKFGLVGDDLEDLSSKFIKFAQLNDTDVSSSVDKTQKVMQAFGMATEDAGKLLDVLNATGQATGISIDTLASSMTKNAVSLQQMGMSAYDAAQFLGQVEMSGANTEQVMTGMQKALVNAAEDGKTLPEVLGEFSEMMTSGATEQEKLNAAIDLFGKKAGPAIYEACKSGSLDLKAFSGDVSEYLGNVETTFDNTLDAPDRMTIALNNIKDAGADIGSTLLDIAAPAIETVGEKVSALGDWFKSLDEDGQEAVGNVVAALLVGGPAISAAGGLVGALGQVIEVAGNAATAVGGIGGAILPIGILIATLGLVKTGIELANDEAIASVEGLAKLQTDSEEVITRLNSSIGGVKETVQGVKDSVNEINNTAFEADQLVDELYRLDAVTDKTAAQQAKMQSIVDRLNEMYPELSIAIDDTTGSLTKGKNEVKEYIRNARNLALLEAYTTGAKGAYEKLAQANKDLYDAQQEQKEGLSVLYDAYHKYYEALEAAPTDVQTGQKLYTDELQRAETAYYAARDAQGKLNDAVHEAKAVIDDATEECGFYTQQTDDLSASMNKATKSEKEHTESVEDSTAANEKSRQSFADRAREIATDSAGAIKAMKDEQTQWDELYKSTKDSIEGQIKLFDEWKQDSDVTFGSILHNMKTQTWGMKNYTKNLETLAKAAAESGDENFKAFVQYIADMGVEGAAVAEAMVKEMEKEGGDFNRALKQFGFETGAEANLAKIITYIKNDFQTGAQSGAKAFNAAIDQMGNDSVLGRLRTSTQDTFKRVSQNMFGVADDATKAGSQAADNLETEVNGANLKPSVKSVEVPESVTKSATTKIEDDVKPTVKVSSLSVWDAIQNARTAMQSYFNNNPIIAKLKGGSVAHNANGGIIQNETLSWLAEGNQPEAVIPLAASKRTRALDLYQQTGEMLGVDTIPTRSSYITMPMTTASGANAGGGSGLGMDAEKLYAAVAEGAAAGMENANVRIYWNDREAGRILRDMGVQFA